MTPSMMITSTIPAPEGSDSTSREGKTIPLPVMEGGNAPPALVQKIGNTTYEVSFHFSTTSRETMSDKINRLIANWTHPVFSKFPHSVLDKPSEREPFCRKLVPSWNVKI